MMGRFSKACFIFVWLLPFFVITGLIEYGYYRLWLMTNGFWLIHIINSIGLGFIAVVFSLFVVGNAIEEYERLS